jgi:Heparinase II/III-like protein
VVAWGVPDRPNPATPQAPGPSRRQFIQAAALAAAASTLALRGAGTAPPPAAPARRGLLFDESDLPRVRRNYAHPRFAQYRRRLEAADLRDDEDFLLHRVRHNRHSDDMLRARLILERTALLTFITDDPRQLGLARLAIRTLLDYPKWDMLTEGGTTVMGLLRAPETILALSFSLDWLGRHLDAGERAAIMRAIADKGAPTCAVALEGMRHPDRVQGWSFASDEDYELKDIDQRRWPLILNSTNLKAVPAAGLGVAACLLHGRDPRAEQWLELARTSLFEFSTMYGSDGSYDEGVSYWVPTTLDVAVCAEVLWRTLGADDRGLINYPGTIRYALSMTLPRPGGPAAPLEPRYDIVNFGDANGSVELSLAAWVARTRGDPVSQFLARDLGEAKYHYGLLWYDPDAPVAEPEKTLLDNRMLNDLVVSRTGWGAADSVVAFRSGGPQNHEHADRNSVIFKAHGERLLHDPFEAAYSRHLPKWRLRLTDAHTAVLVDGKGHHYIDGTEGTNPSDAFARITAFATGPGWMVVTSDATEAYQPVVPAVTRVERTAVFLKPDVLLLLDRVDLGDAALPVQARFQVFNEDSLGSCEARAAGFGVRRPRATLAGRVAGLSPLAVHAGRLDQPADEGVYPFVEVTSAAARRHELLTVCSAAPADLGHGTLEVTREGTAWRVSGVHLGRRVEVVLDTAGAGPPSVAI